MSGWFELSKSTDGQYRFALKADDGSNILTSELYRAKDSAETGIASVRTNSAQDAHYERKMSADAKPFFNLRAANHQVIATSKLFASEQAREAGIQLAKSCGTTETVQDRT